jgi:hypothetical protein
MVKTHSEKPYAAGRMQIRAIAGIQRDIIWGKPIFPHNFGYSDAVAA